LKPSGIVIVRLRYKIEWRPLQHYEDWWEGSPLAPKVGRPLDKGSLPER
jgi:hypothetical protein